MKLPLKISPDHIKESVIEIKYESNLPYEVLVGYIYNSLDDTYKYASHPQQFAINAPNEISINLGVLNLFFTDRIKLQLMPNSLIFNCIDKYIGWKDYKAEIEKTIIQITTIKEIKKFTRVGIRYISEYSEMEIINCTKFNFSFGIPQIKSDNYSFRTEFDWDNLRVVLNLKHSADSTKEIKLVSIIDIDIISDNLNIENTEDLITKIEENHIKEKEVFFNLLKPEYLETLNPEYE